MGSIFTDPLLFLGGDEVHNSCYATDNVTANYLKQHDLQAPAMVDLFWQKLQSPEIWANISGGSRTLGVWVSDTPDPAGCYNGSRPCPVLPINTSSSVLKNGTVVAAYQSNYTAAELISSGRPTIAAYGNLYLATDPGGGDGGWQARHSRELCDEIAAEGACAATGEGNLLIGGLASAWGENLNSANFDTVVWPSLLAVAERLWSPKLQARDIETTSQGKGTVAAAARIAVMACHMRTRHGVPVAAGLQPGFCEADVRWQP
jgi:hypothetical protein